MQECTFNPKINKKNKMSASLKHKSFYERVLDFEKIKKEKLTHKILQKKLNRPSFKPQINQISKLIDK